MLVRGMCNIRKNGTVNASLTFEYGADLPHSDAALAGVLAECDFQDEDRGTAGDQADEVRDQEGPCTRQEMRINTLSHNKAIYRYIFTIERESRNN